MYKRQDLDSVIEVVSVTFKTDDKEIELLPALLYRFDENQDGKIKLSELDCEQWDVLSFTIVRNEGITELVPCTKYELNFEFKFEEDAGNEYQGDRIVVKMIFTALQEQWEEVGGVQEKPVAKGLLLVEKDTTTWEIIWDGAWGEILYKDSYSPVAMLLILHDLEPNNWYLVTFQAGNWWSGSDIPDDATGMFGHKSADSIEWIDVALVKTDDSGNANIIIPTTSGLTKEDLANPSDWTDINLTSGSYKCSVVVKDVGSQNGGDIPNLGELLAGGTAVLFETELLEFTVGSS